MARIGQIFINREGIETFLCLNNYVSFLAPTDERSLSVNIVLFDENGRGMLEATEVLKKGEARAIAVRDLVGDMPCIGLASCDAGVGNTQFFTYYVHRVTEAMAMIHPQSTVFQTDVGPAWRCCQSIATLHLEKLEIFHANHSTSPCEVTYELRDVRENLLVGQKTTVIPALSARCTEFSAQDYVYAPVVSLSTSRLPSPNGKPLIMRRYADQRFSMSHG